jgi:hypothetical protein
VVAIAVIVVMMMTDDLDAVMILVMMTDDHDAMMILVMMMDHDNLVVTVPIAVSVVVSVADADGYAALLRNHHPLVACCRPSQCRRDQDCERARDKSQLVHVMFLHWVTLLSRAVVQF